MAVQIAHFYNEVVPLRLATSLQQLQSVLGEAGSQEELIGLFGKALEEAQEAIRRRFQRMLEEMGSFFTRLKNDTETVASYVSSTQLTTQQSTQFADFRCELMRTHEEILIRGLDNKKLSQLVIGILEFKMRQITRQRKLSDFNLRADFQNYVNKAISDLEGEQRAVELGTPTESEKSSPPKHDPDFHHLMLHGAPYDSPKSHSKPVHWTFSPTHFDRELKLQVALTDAKIKKVKEISEVYRRKED